MIKASLNKNLIEKFKQNGFIILDEFLNLQYLDELKNRIEPLFKGKFETGIEPDEWNWRHEIDSEYVTRQICNAWKSDNFIRNVICHEVVGKFCSQLMNWSGSKLIQDNVLWKPPGGKTLAYHQDSAYVDWIIPQSMITCWISLDDTTKEKGTLEYVRGSHEWGIEPPKGKFHSPEDYKIELNKFAKKNNKKIETTYVEVPTGGVAFHHGSTWHGSGINKSQENRRAIVAHCVPHDAKFHPTNTGGTGRIYKRYKRNDTDELDDSFFPLLWQEK